MHNLIILVQIPPEAVKDFCNVNNEPHAGLKLVLSAMSPLALSSMRGLVSFSA
jgi:hypothetical protein